MRGGSRRTQMRQGNRDRGGNIGMKGGARGERYRLGERDGKMKRDRRRQKKDRQGEGKKKTDQRRIEKNLKSE